MLDFLGFSSFSFTKEIQQWVNSAIGWNRTSSSKASVRRPSAITCCTAVSSPPSTCARRDDEVVIVANTNTLKGQDQSVNVIVDSVLNELSATYQILYSNKAAPTAPGAVQQRENVTVHEVDGSISNGPLHVVRVTWQPMEVQILGR
jgi:hypothetical protein